MLHSRGNRDVGTSILGIYCHLKLLVILRLRLVIVIKFHFLTKVNENGWLCADL